MENEHVLPTHLIGKFHSFIYILLAPSLSIRGKVLTPNTNSRSFLSKSTKLKRSQTASNIESILLNILSQRGFLQKYAKFGRGNDKISVRREWKGVS